MNGQPFICADCRKVKSVPPGNGGTGYALFANSPGESPTRIVCYACCAERTKSDMAVTGKAGLYLVPDERAADGKTVLSWKLTDWGGALSYPASRTRFSRHGGGFASPRRDAWFTGPDGHEWHAICRGDQNFARCRRLTKGLR